MSCAMRFARCSAGLEPLKFYSNRNGCRCRAFCSMKILCAEFSLCVACIFGTLVRGGMGPTIYN